MPQDYISWFGNITTNRFWNKTLKILSFIYGHGATPTYSSTLYLEKPVHIYSLGSNPTWARELCSSIAKQQDPQGLGRLVVISTDNCII